MPACSGGGVGCVIFGSMQAWLCCGGGGEDRKLLLRVHHRAETWRLSRLWLLH